MNMTEPQFQSKDINPNDYPFFTGNVAMSENFLWSTYGVSDLDDWDMAAIPAYNGKQTSVLNADTFRILKSTKHPDEAFQFLTYLLGEASRELLTAYGGFPARTADQAAGIEALQAQFNHTGRLAGRRRRRQLPGQPELRVVDAGLQREPRPRRVGREVPDPPRDDAGARSWTRSSNP